MCGKSDVCCGPLARVHVHVHMLTIRFGVGVRHRSLRRLVQEASFVEFPCVNHPVSQATSTRTVNPVARLYAF